MSGKVFSMGRVIVGLAIVAVGLVFLLENLGFSISGVWNLWPLALVAVGVAKIGGSQGTSSKLFGGLLILVGVLALFDLWNLWPLLIILFGLLVLWKGVGRSGVPQMGRSSTTANEIREFVVFGSSERVVNASAFKGGELTAIFGGVDLDLRDSEMEPGTPVVVDCFALFGGIDLRVPDGWEVVGEAAAIFGGFEDKTRKPSEGYTALDSGGPRVLIVRGYALFGGLEIKN